MKDQYFGDAGDYGKYGLLRFLARNEILIGVHWYLTPPDGSADGKFISYLSDKKLEWYDPVLFHTLKTMVWEETTRSVACFGEKNLIPGATYYYDFVPSNVNCLRDLWHKNALDLFGDRELIFMDPDNGLIKKGSRRSYKQKFCFSSEVADFYNAGKNVVYYCSKGRRTHEQWLAAKTVMKQELPDAHIRVLTYHKGTQRSYVFILHPTEVSRYHCLLNEFLQKWNPLFSDDLV